MFQISEYIDLDPFQKIGYVADEIGIEIDELAQILQLNQNLLSLAINEVTIKWQEKTKGDPSDIKGFVRFEG